VSLPTSVFLPIAHTSTSIALLVGVGGLVGLLSGLFGVGGGFLLTPLLMMLGISPMVAAASDSAAIVAAATTGTLEHSRAGTVDYRIQAEAQESQVQLSALILGTQQDGVVVEVGPAQVRAHHQLAADLQFGPDFHRSPERALAVAPREHHGHRVIVREIHRAAQPSSCVRAQRAARCDGIAHGEKVGAVATVLLHDELRDAVARRRIGVELVLGLLDEPFRTVAAHDGERAGEQVVEAGLAGLPRLAHGSHGCGVGHCDERRRAEEATEDPECRATNGHRAPA